MKKLLLLLIVSICLVGCSNVKMGFNDDLEGLTIESIADFSIKLFKENAKKNENALISPTSVITSISLIANGANKGTLAQMEYVIGGELGEINNHVKYLDKNSLKISNSLWYREDITIEDNFINIISNDLKAYICGTNFDNQTIKDIKHWVGKNIKGETNKLIEDIAEDTIMYLINTAYFDAEWEIPYDSQDISMWEFKGLNVRNVEMMNSVEMYYIDDGKSIGFIKPYKEDYSFVAILPNNGINKYISEMSGEDFINNINTLLSRVLFI